jgi:hypothetical protein
MMLTTFNLLHYLDSLANICNADAVLALSETQLVWHQRYGISDSADTASAMSQTPLM